MFSSTTGITVPPCASTDPDDIVEPEPDETDSGRPLSRDAHHWLEGLMFPEQWVSSDEPRRHAEFFIDIVGLMHGMGIFSSHGDLLVSWATFDRDKPATVISSVLPGREAESEADSNAESNADSNATCGARQHPWITGFFTYNGDARIGVGEVADVGGQSSPVLHDSWPMRASRVFELAACVARRGHQAEGQVAPPCCDNGTSLRSALVRHLRRRPDLAGQLARKFPLTHRFEPPPLSQRQTETNFRTSREQLQPGAQAVDYRVPGDVLRVLAADTVLRVNALCQDRLRSVARTLKISPTALRCAFVAQGTMPLTVLGAQCLHPELVRGTSQARRAGPGDRAADRSVTAHALFENGDDLADALSRGILRSASVRNLRWHPSEGVG